MATSYKQLQKSLVSHMGGSLGVENSTFPYLTKNLWILMAYGIIFDTLPKFNIAPEKWWLEYYFPIGKVTFQGLC